MSLSGQGPALVLKINTDVRVVVRIRTLVAHAQISRANREDPLVVDVCQAVVIQNLMADSTIEIFLTALPISVDRIADQRGSFLHPSHCKGRRERR